MLCKTHKSNCPIWGKLTLLGVVIFVVATLPFIMSISRMKSLVLWKSFAVFNYSLSHLHHTMFHLQERKPALSWRCSQGFLTPFKMLCHLWQNLAWWPKGIRNRRVRRRDPCVKVPMALWGVEAELDQSVKTATECHVKLDFILQEKNRRLPNQEMITCS